MLIFNLISIIIVDNVVTIILAKGMFLYLLPEKENNCFCGVLLPSLVENWDQKKMLDF